MWQGLKALVVAFFITLSLTPIIKLISLRFGWVDKPLPRRINKIPIPTLGGVAIFVGFLGASLLSWPVARFRHLPALYLSSFLMFLLGTIDDVYNLTPKVKFWSQVFIATIYVLLGPKIQYLTNPSGGIISLSWFSIPISIIWLVSIANFVNFIDGLDGLAAGTVVIATFTCALLTKDRADWFVLVLNCALLGASLGFLPFNFHPAKIFMGDSGALFLGFTVGALAIEGSLKGAATVTLIVPFLALGLPVIDTVFAIFRRAKQGLPVYKADGDHLHHRVLRLGLGQKKTVLILYLVNALFAIGAFLLFSVGPEVGFIYTVLVLILVILKAAREGVLRVGEKQKDQSDASVWNTTRSNQNGSSNKGINKR